MSSVTETVVKGQVFGKPETLVRNLSEMARETRETCDLLGAKGLLTGPGE